MLVGDACHAMAPNLAQGACLSIEDSLELAHLVLINSLDQSNRFNLKSLEALLNDTNKLEDMLGEYSKRRRKRAAIVQFLVPNVHRVGRMDGVLAKLRNFVFK